MTEAWERFPGRDLSAGVGNLSERSRSVPGFILQVDSLAKKSRVRTERTNEEAGSSACELTCRHMEERVRAL